MKDFTNQWFLPSEDKLKNINLTLTVLDNKFFDVELLKSEKIYFEALNVKLQKFSQVKQVDFGEIQCGVESFIFSNQSELTILIKNKSMLTKMKNYIENGKEVDFFTQRGEFLTIKILN